MQVIKREQIEAAGAVLFRFQDGVTQVALIFRKGKWDLPKGKKEEDESIRVCAKRELEEELGIQDVTIHDELLHTYHEYAAFEKDWGKTTFWFVATAPIQKFNPQAEEDIEQVEWFDIDSAAQKVGYDNLIRVLEAFKNWTLRKKYAE
ncbi:NUDIX domain-containing protein [bacterium]|nr:MAG: NUDIX domain-containing protein [bacterium]